MPPGKSPKKKKKPRQSAQHAFYPQRADFVGELKWFKGRPPVATVMIILKDCIVRGAEKSVTEAELTRVAMKSGIPLENFLAHCYAPWDARTDSDREVLRFLQAAGYEGTIDDLWQSAHRIRRPSPPPPQGVGNPKMPWPHNTTGGLFR